MAFKLVVSNKIKVKVEGQYTDHDNQEKKFNFYLHMDRVENDELDTVMKSPEPAGAFVARKTHGWEGQRLVLTEDEKPADFSPEALDVLLSIAGMGGYCWRAYLDQVMVHAKN
jgi:hypothetical protein